MPRYIVTLTEEEKQELKLLVQKGGKGYRIKHAQILLKLDQKPENKTWTYDRIKDAYGASRNTIAGVAKRFIMEGMEAALGRKEQKNRHRKVTGDVEARICTIAWVLHPNKWTIKNEPNHKMNKTRRISNTFYTLLCSQDRATLESDLSGPQRFKADSRSVFIMLRLFFMKKAALKYKAINSGVWGGAPILILMRIKPFSACFIRSFSRKLESVVIIIIYKFFC